MKELLRIGDIEYSTRPLDVMRAVSLHARVIHALGEGFGKGLSTIGAPGSTIAQIAAGILGSIAQANTEELFELIPEVMREVKANGELLSPSEMPMHFQVYPSNLYPVFTWALAVNIRPFLEGSLPGWKAFMSAVGLKFQMPGKENGSSGDQSSPGSSRGKPFPERPQKK